MQDITVVPDSSTGWDPTPRVAGRYVVGELVGRGGGGQVHCAHDTFTGEAVALKLIRVDGQGTVAQLRRELTALRLIDLPGVVRLRDDGEHENFVFLVMDWIGGGTFDTLRGRAWAEWRDCALGLLEAVGRLHFAGLVHGDLKPTNVLLDAQGCPVVTDFGLASGVAVADHDANWVAGTPHYMAPEQVRGDQMDARTDLYALGVMFSELRAPEDVKQVFQWMQCEAPEDRPSSVECVLQALGEGSDALVGTFVGLDDPVTPAQAQALFGSGPTFLHVAADAAGLLLEQTDASHVQVSALLAQWIRAGSCYRDADQLVMSRPALEQLRWERRPALASLEAALVAHQEGNTRRGLAILTALHPTAGVADATVELSLSLWSPRVVRAAAYRAERHDWPHAGRVLSAATALLAGNAKKALDTLGHPMAQPERLQGWSLGVGISAAIRVGGVERWLQAAERWAETAPDGSVRLAAWSGRVAYVHGDFEKALREERAALAGARVPAVRLSRLTTAAAAAIETQALQEARRWAEEARGIARALGHGAAEARAWWLLRTVALRSGQHPAPQPQWVDPAMEVSGFVGAQLALTEAALAWHHDQTDLAGSLALRAMRGFGSRVAISDLARALAWRCGVADPPKHLSGLDPELDLQTWVLCRNGGQRLGMVPKVPATRLQGRWLDVLAGDACHAALTEESH